MYIQSTEINKMSQSGLEEILLSHPPKNLAGLQKFIKKQTNLNILKGEGYYYFISDNLDLSSVDASVKVSSVKELSHKQWLSCAKAIIEAIETKK